MELFVGVKNDSVGDKDNIFTKFEKCIEKFVDAKERVDSKSRELRQFSDMQRVNIEKGTKSYSDIAGVDEHTGILKLSQISQRLSEIFYSIRALSKGLVDYL